MCPALYSEQSTYIPKKVWADPSLLSHYRDMLNLACLPTTRGRKPIIVATLCVWFSPGSVLSPIFTLTSHYHGDLCIQETGPTSCLR